MLWVKQFKNGDEVTHGWVCDVCNKKSTRATPYCPYCADKKKGRISNPLQTNVDDFIEASDPTDWIGKPTQDIYSIYWNWCLKQNIKPVDKIIFMRTVLSTITWLASRPMGGRRYFREV